MVVPVVGEVQVHKHTQENAFQLEIILCKILGYVFGFKNG